MIYLFDNQDKLIDIITEEDLIDWTYTVAINAFDEAEFELPIDYKVAVVKEAVYFGFFGRGDEFKVFRVTEKNLKEECLIKGIDRAESDLRTVSIIQEKRPYNVTAEQALYVALEGTGYEVGQVEGLPLLGKVNFYYISPREALVKIIETWNCEFRVRYTFVENRISSRYVDLFKREGKATGRQFYHGDDLLSVEHEESSDDVVTALIGRGKGEEIIGADGQATGGYGRRIEFTDVVWSKAAGKPVDKPAGQNYVVSELAREKFGLFQNGQLKHRWGVFIDEQIEDKEVLLQRTWEELQKLSIPITTYKASLVEIGSDIWKGDSVAIIRDDIGLAFEARIHKIVIDQLNKNRSRVELGDYATLRERYSSGKTLQSAINEAFDGQSLALQEFLLRLEEEKTRKNAEIDEKFRVFQLEIDHAIEGAKNEAEQAQAELASGIENKLIEQRKEAEKARADFTQGLAASRQELEEVADGLERELTSMVSGMSEKVNRDFLLVHTTLSEAVQKSNQAKLLAESVTTQQGTLLQQLAKQKSDQDGWRAAFEASVSSELGAVKSQLSEVRGKFDSAGNLAAFETYKRIQEESARSVRTQLEKLEQDSSRISSLETEMQVQAGEVRTKMRQLESQIPTEIGSRNYAEDYDFSRGLWEYSQGDGSVKNWNVNKGVYTVTGTTTTWKQLQIHSESGARTGGKSDSTALLELKEGETYTLSVEVKVASGSGNFWLELRDNGLRNYDKVVTHLGGSSTIIAATNKWVRYSITGSIKPNSDFGHRRIILGYSAIGSISFRKVELTHSSLFTDAGPAPEDSQSYVHSKLAEYRQTVDGQFASVQSALNGKVSQSSFEQTTQRLRQSVSSLENNVLKKTEVLIEKDRIQLGAGKVLDGSTVASLLTVQPEAIRAVTNKMVITSQQANLVGETYRNVCKRVSKSEFVVDTPLLVDEREFLITGEALRVSGSGSLYFDCKVIYSDNSSKWHGATVRLTNTTKAPFQLTSKLNIPSGKTVASLQFFVNCQPSDVWELCNLSILPKTSAELLVDGSITARQLDIESARAGILTANSILAYMIQANAITADKLKVDTAMIDKFASNDALINSLVAKRAFITAVQAIDLSATRIKGGVLQALNGATAFNLNTGALDFYTDNPAIRRVVSGYPTQFVRFTTGNVEGKGKAGVTVIGSNRNGTESSNDGGFVGIRAWNGSTIDSLDLVGDQIRLASSAFDNSDGWVVTTLDSGLRIYPQNRQAERNSRIEIGDVWVLTGTGKYSSLRSIIRNIHHSIQELDNRTGNLGNVYRDSPI